MFTLQVFSFYVDSRSAGSVNMLYLHVSVERGLKPFVVLYTEILHNIEFNKNSEKVVSANDWRKINL